MPGKFKTRTVLAFWGLMASCVAGTGCQACLSGGPCLTPPAETHIPRELEKVAQPPYAIEPPDVLLIDAVRVVPLPPYRLGPLDQLIISVTGDIPEPINGLYAVDADGTINLGPTYGTVRVDGMTLEVARKAIEDMLKMTFKNLSVRMVLYQSRAMQQIRGEHQVRPDGTVGLGTYGSVFVSGMSLDQAKAAIEQQLSKYLEKPEVSVDILFYNSKAYYIIADGGGYGEQVYRFPSTGSETVLDAVANIYGLPVAANKKRIWVARPAPADAGCLQVLPVDWNAIVRGGATVTNYQIMPGDRIYVEADPLLTLNSELARLFAPIQTTLGTIFLGNEVVHSIAIPLGRSTSGAGF
jgi:polysaccharide export outer membrane protein